MNLLNTLLLAIREIRRNFMRSVLTTLGIVIGVGAVITMVTLGRGATQMVTAQISGLGRNLLVVLPESAGRKSGVAARPAPFKIEDVRAITEEVSGVAAAAPMTYSGTLAVFGNQNRSTTINGTDNSFFEVRDWRLENGREFSDAELQGGKRVCILGATVKREMYGFQDPVGSTLRLGNLSCQVIGVLESKGATFGEDQDDFVLIPLRTFQRRVAGNRDVNLIFVGARTSDGTEKVQKNLTALLQQRREISDNKPNNFRIQDMKEITRTIGVATGILTAFLSAIAAVSLIVGGIGIMNIMLVSVTERTREIGIRLAIGAMEREVLTQFLVEAVTLSLLGGLIGIVGGLGVSAIICWALGMPFVFDAVIVLIAFLFAGAVGVVFGYLPARKAARMDPIDALRYE